MGSLIEDLGIPVPGKRLSRLWHLGRATTDLAVGIGISGLIELARNRNGDQINRIRLSPVPTQRFTERLATLRGAAMKLGQLMSMDGTDLFTPEVAEIMAGLRDRAQTMPIGQLNQVLSAELGKDWDRRFRRFEFKPLAAASIGQVHRAETRDGRHLAIKVQFPGVRESIDSDIDNLTFLGRTLGLVPKGFDLGPILAEARHQLHREADYRAEAASLELYAALLDGDPDFLLPRVHHDLSSSRVLSMDFVTGIPVDQLADPNYRQADRDRAAGLLARLVLRELFGFGLVQTDPNFGNYLYQPAAGRLVLLDFGATQPVPAILVGYYRRLARAAIDGDAAVMREAAVALGYLDAGASAEKASGLIELLRLAAEPLRHQGIYDFGASDLFEKTFVRGRDLYFDDAYGHHPNPATLFLHRKFVGTFMLCRRLRARLDLGAQIAAYL